MYSIPKVLKSKFLIKLEDLYSITYSTVIMVPSWLMGKLVQEKLIQCRAMILMIKIVEV